MLTDHPFADMIASCWAIAVHDRFCVERMVAAIESIYDQGWVAWKGRGGVLERPPVVTAA